MNVLIVDDSMITRAVLKRAIILSKLEFSNIYDAADGEKGLKVLENNKIDIILTDINMPVLNGIEFITKLREKEELKDIPVIIISGHDSSKMKESLTGIEYDDYVKKPFIPEQIRDVISKVIQK